jgi:FMN-dependent oxidoreductase (nitrilotriacetate monooxygenase family)
LARLLEAGKFDGIFLADVLGVYDVYGGDARSAIREGAQIPVNDPILVVPAMAAATRHLGFGVTATLSYEPPYPFARRMSTLDHLTKGRIGWNIVTGYLDSAARGVGEARQTAHDNRYDIADEYIEVVYKLWEGSWEDDAVQRDSARGIYSQPDKVHRIRHHGAHFKVDGYHLAEPSPQRSPLLFQAGTSRKGRDFAARHAECVFVTGPSIGVIAPRVADIRRRAAAYGRSPREVLVFAQIAVIVDRTQELAARKYEDYRRYMSPAGILTLIAGFTGVDFAKMSLDEPIRYVENDAIHSAIESLTTADPNKVWTPRELAEFAGIGGIAPLLVGEPEAVADELIRWAESTDVDGFNLAYAITPRDFSDFIELVVPVLQRRGAFKTGYEDGTLRHKLFAPATDYRRPIRWRRIGCHPQIPAM